MHLGNPSLNKETDFSWDIGSSNGGVSQGQEGRRDFKLGTAASVGPI